MRRWLVPQRRARVVPDGPAPRLPRRRRAMQGDGEVYVGLDVSKLKVSVALAEAGRDGEVRFLGEVENTPEGIGRLVAKLAKRHRRLAFCYEAGPTGYGLHRQVTALGHDCAVVALSITHIVCSWRGMDVGPYPTERDGPTPVGTSVARGGADGPRRECLDRSRDRRMPVRRRAAGPTVACAARPDGGRDGREHPARLPGLGQHQGGLPLLLQ